jgi:glutathione-regulated potassium-efflux system ancillary protein KefC
LETAYLLAPFIGGIAAMIVRLPPLVGFLAAGFALNAMGYGRTSALDTIAGLGVTLLLFTIGLKLNVRTLLRREVWGSATMHMVASTGVLMGVLALLKLIGIALLAGAGWQSLAVIGFALSFSSTVFAVKVLEQRGESRSLYGRIAIGVLIMQDIIAVIFLTASTAELPSPLAFLLILLIPAAPVLQRVLARIGHGEMQVLFGVVLALVLGFALFDSVGIKGDLGALVIGMLLAPHPAAEPLSKSLFNLKELFLVGFFMSIGLTALPTVQTFAMALILVALVLAKGMLFLALFSGFRLRRRTAVLAALSLTNFSEFGLIIAVLASGEGWLSDDWLVVLSVAVAISFVTGALLNARDESAYRWVERRLPPQDTTTLHPDDQPIELGDAQAVVLGLGRVGEGAYRRLRDHYGLRVLGVDNDPDKTAQLRNVGFTVVDGDADDSDFWDKIVPSEDVKLVLLAMPHHAGNSNALRELRDRHFAGRIAVVVQHRDQLEPMRAAGADAVFHLYEEAGPALADRAADACGLEEPGKTR